MMAPSSPSPSRSAMVSPRSSPAAKTSLTSSVTGTGHSAPEGSRMSRSTPSYSAALMNPSSGANAPFSTSSRSQSWRGVRSQLFASRARRRASPSAASSRSRLASLPPCASLNIPTSNSGNEPEPPAVPAPATSAAEQAPVKRGLHRTPSRPRLDGRCNPVPPGRTYCPAHCRRAVLAALRSRPCAGQERFIGAAVGMVLADIAFWSWRGLRASARQRAAIQSRASDAWMRLKSSITVETSMPSERSSPCAIWLRTS